MPFIRVFQANLSNSVKLPHKRLRSQPILAIIFARINGPINYLILLKAVVEALKSGH